MVFFEKTFKVTNESITGTIRYTANGETKPVPKGAFVSFEREVNGSRIGVMTFGRMAGMSYVCVRNIISIGI